MNSSTGSLAGLGQRVSTAADWVASKIGIGALFSPFLIGTVILIVIPTALTFYLAFTQYDTLSPPVWIGLDNFKALLTTDPLIKIALGNSILFVVMAVPLRVIGALALAILLKGRYRNVGIYRAAVFLPTIVPEVPYALLWLWILNPLYGPLNGVLTSMGIIPPQWLAHPLSASASILLMTVFQLGEGFVFLLAGLQQVPWEYYQAAAVDGATGWQTFRYITWPLIRPWLVLLTLRDIILNAQNTLTPTYVMTDGGPYLATYYLPIYVFDMAFEHLTFGYGSAIMIFLLILIGVILFIAYRLLRGWGYADEL